LSCKVQLDSWQVRFQGEDAFDVELIDYH
jgi:hypothetical protein